MAHESTFHTCAHPCTALPISWICLLLLYVALSYHSAGPAGYHPPLSRSPLFQVKRALLRCSVLPICRTRRLSPTAGAVPLFQRKRAFVVHHPPPSFMSKDLQACTTPSLLPCGRRGTARAVEDRELASSLEYLAFECSSLHCPANQPDPPAITHRKRSPSFRKRGLPSVAPYKKIPPLYRGGILDIGFSVFTYRYSLL